MRSVSRIGPGELKFGRLSINNFAILLGLPFQTTFSKLVSKLVKLFILDYVFQELFI